MGPTAVPTDWRISHYRVLASLGKGGMGEVYAAFDETLKRRVALKSVRADYSFSAESKSRFLREARLLSQLDQPNVCRVYDYFEDQSTGWLVLELIEGHNLRDHIARGPDTHRKMEIAAQIAERVHARQPANPALDTRGVLRTQQHRRHSRVET